MTEETLETIKTPKRKTIPLVSDVIFKAVFKRERRVLLKMTRDIF